MVTSESSRRRPGVELHIVGYQCAGTIREVGEQVKDRKVGDRVVAVLLRLTRQTIAVPYQTTWVLPDDVTTEDGSAIPRRVRHCVRASVHIGHLKAGETVLVQGGAGGVGIAAIQMAKRAGATTIATASSDEKLEGQNRVRSTRLGINYAEVELVEEARRITNGRGVDLAVDSVGSTLLGSIESLTYRGRAITVGDAARGRRPFDPAVLDGTQPDPHRRVPRR